MNHKSIRLLLTSYLQAERSMGTVTGVIRALPALAFILILEKGREEKMCIGKSASK